MFHEKLKVLAATLTALAAFGVGCTKQGTGEQVPVPREVLAKYVAEVFAVKKPDDISRLLEFTSGSAKEELQKLKDDPDLFKKTFLDQEIESASALRIRDEKRIDDNRYSIVYELSYRDRTKAEKVETAEPVMPMKEAHTGEVVTKDAASNTVTAKKHAVFVRDEQTGKWLIDEVQNLKTFVEHTTEENISAEPPQKK